MLVRMPQTALSTTEPKSPDRRRKPVGQSRYALRARRKFLRIFPNGFRDLDYVELERAYKWNAHLAWQRILSKRQFARLLRDQDYVGIAAEAVRIESRTNLLFSFEKMALRDAVKTPPSRAGFLRVLIRAALR